jgi:hypothetical protein
MMIGIFIGIFVLLFIADSEASSLLEFLSEWLLFVQFAISLYLGILLHVILHEAGHLVCGLISGYKFVSFTIGKMMFIIKDGKLKRKKFAIKGFAGQCLMSPPEPVNEVPPFVLYHSGGVLANFIASGIYIALYMGLQGVFPYADEVFIPFIGVGIIMGISNILPLKISGVPTDGCTIASLAKSEQARRAMWILLTANAKIAAGERLKNLPEPWFSSFKLYDLNDHVLANLVTMKLGRLIDCHEFEEAKTLAERSWQEGDKMIGTLRGIVLCELLFLEIIDEPHEGEKYNRLKKIEQLYTPELEKAVKKASKIHLSNCRLIYAYEKLVSFDTEKAEKARKVFDKICRTYPYTGECESERELMAIIDDLAAGAQIV